MVTNVSLIYFFSIFLVFNRWDAYTGERLCDTGEDVWAQGVDKNLVFHEGKQQ